MPSIRSRSTSSFRRQTSCRTKPLIRLILNQIGRRLTETLELEGGVSKRRRVLLHAR